MTFDDPNVLVALLYIHDTWMSIERKRVRGDQDDELSMPSRGEAVSEDYDEAYDDISRSDDVSEAVHAPDYKVRQDRGVTVRGTDRLTVSTLY